MARKPLKKRKAVKRKAKPVRRKPVFDKKPKVLDPKFNLKVGTPEDPLFIDPKTIPDGVALQWVMNSVMGEPEGSLPYYDANSLTFMKMALAGGWKPVKGQDEVRGLVLMWAPSEVAKAQHQADFDRAKDQIREASALFGLDEYGRKSDRRGFPLVTPSFIVSREYTSVPADSPPVDVDIAIKVRISVRWQESAAALDLDVQEYARRRLLMEPTVLGPCSMAYHYDNVSDRSNVYEPVQLSFTRKD